MPFSRRFCLSAVVILSAFLAACAPVSTPVATSAPDPAPRPVIPAPTADLSGRAQRFVAMVNQVEPVAEAECRARAPRLDCDFLTLVDDRPDVPANAYQTRDSAGRPVIVFTLALIAAAENADELAFVFSHEAAHHILGHLDLQNRNATLGAVVFGQLANVTGAGSPAAIRAAQEFGAVLGSRTYSMDYELDADALGAIIAHRAGYDPLRGAEFFARMPDPGNRFLGSHPPNAARVARVRQVVAGL